MMFVHICMYTHTSLRPACVYACACVPLCVFAMEKFSRSWTDKAGNERE